jgi:hypothetical protein
MVGQKRPVLLLSRCRAFFAESDLDFRDQICFFDVGQGDFD